MTTPSPAAETATLTTNPPPGAIELHGQHYMQDAKGNLVPLENVKAVDLVMHELVHKLVDYAEDLSAELARFLAHSMADVAAFDALLDQEYGVKRPEATKGNRTLTSYDGCRQVKVQVADRIQLGPELQVAKKLLDAMIQEKAEGADPFLVALVNQAFAVDKEGRVDVNSILALRRLEVDDPRWTDITRAIDDSVRIVGTKRYLRFYRRAQGQDQWELVPLDLAAVQASAASWEQPWRPSLRHQVRRLVQANDAALEKLSVALTLMEDGAMVSAARAIAMAAEALGGNLSAEVTEYEAYVAEVRARMAIDHPRAEPTNEEA